MLSWSMCSTEDEASVNFTKTPDPHFTHARGSESHCGTQLCSGRQTQKVEVYGNLVWFVSVVTVKDCCCSV
jgi:hypothetical protein